MPSSPTFGPPQMPFNEPPWHPETNPVLLKTLGKALEELGELSAATARCIIQGADELEPTTGKPNRQWLKEEIIDVMVNLHLVDEYLMLNLMDAEGLARFDRKYAQLKTWHKDA